MKRRKKLVMHFGFCLYLQGLTQMKWSTRKSQTRLPRLIQYFDSLSIFIDVSSSLIVIYNWRDPFTLQTIPRRDPFIYKSQIPCNLSPISITKFTQHILSPTRFIEHRVNTTHQSIQINLENDKSTQPTHSLFRTFLLWLII